MSKTEWDELAWSLCLPWSQLTQTQRNRENYLFRMGGGQDLELTERLHERGNKFQQEKEQA